MVSIRYTREIKLQFDIAAGRLRPRVDSLDEVVIPGRTVQKRIDERGRMAVSEWWSAADRTTAAHTSRATTVLVACCRARLTISVKRFLASCSAQFILSSPSRQLAYGPEGVAVSRCFTRNGLSALAATLAEKREFLDDRLTIDMLCKIAQPRTAGAGVVKRLISRSRGSTQ